MLPVDSSFSFTGSGTSWASSEAGGTTTATGRGGPARAVGCRGLGSGAPGSGAGAWRNRLGHWQRRLFAESRRGRAGSFMAWRNGGSFAWIRIEQPDRSVCEVWRGGVKLASRGGVLDGRGHRFRPIAGCPFRARGHGRNADPPDMGLFGGITRSQFQSAKDGRDRAAVEEEPRVGDDRESQALAQGPARPPAQPGDQPENERTQPQQCPDAQVGSHQEQEGFEVQSGVRSSHDLCLGPGWLPACPARASPFLVANLTLETGLAAAGCLVIAMASIVSAPRWSSAPENRSILMTSES